MPQEIIMPKLGLTMTQGKITKWLKKVGDPVAKGEVVVEIETDKISYEVEAPINGYIVKILVEEGEDKEITAPLCIVEEKNELIGTPETKPKIQNMDNLEKRIFITPIAKKTARENKLDYSGLTGSGPNGRIVKKDILNLLSEKTMGDDNRVKITPIAKKMALDNGIDYMKLKGSGPDGRIVKEDILSAIQKKEEMKAVHEEKTEVIKEAVLEKPIDSDKAVARRIPFSGMRRVIATRLSQSKHDIPHVYFKTVIDAANMIELKNKLSESVKLRTGNKLSLNDIIIKAVAAAIREFEEVNVSLINDEIVYFSSINIGMAVSVEKGLVVPVIKGADKMSLSEINKKSGELISKARGGNLTLDEMSGGTFTISNLGSYDIDEFSAIINPPESAILAVGKAKEIPMVVDGQIVVRSAMTITLSVDHRLIDGAMAALFMRKLKEMLENPYLILI